MERKQKKLCLKETNPPTIPFDRDGGAASLLNDTTPLCIQATKILLDTQNIRTPSRVLFIRFSIPHISFLFFFFLLLLFDCWFYLFVWWWKMEPSTWVGVMTHKGRIMGPRLYLLYGHLGPKWSHLGCVLEWPIYNM